MKERERETRFLRKYGLTLSDYEERYEAQLGKCLICETGFPMFGLHVDHDHDSGVVRGLLCGPCNRALGWYERTKSDYEKYEAYLGRSAT